MHSNGQRGHRWRNERDFFEHFGRLENGTRCCDPGALSSYQRYFFYFLMPSSSFQFSLIFSRTCLLLPHSHHLRLHTLSLLWSFMCHMHVRKLLISSKIRVSCALITRLKKLGEASERYTVLSFRACPHTHIDIFLGEGLQKVYTDALEQAYWGSKWRFKVFDGFYTHPKDPATGKVQRNCCSTPHLSSK